MPRKYLKGFCSVGNDSMLWQYDKVRDSFDRVGVANAANENGFYSDEVEKKLCELIENPANGVIDKLRVGQSIDDNDRARLAIYIATMLKRVPAHRERAKKLLPQILADTIAEMTHLISQAGEAGVLTPEQETARRSQTESVGASLRANTPQQVLEKIRTPWPGREFTELIFLMPWRFFESKGPSFFLTSDNPAFFFECYGLKNDEAELVFPISSTLALHGSWQALKQGENRIRTLPQNLVREFNRRIANAATRFVFYMEKQRWIKEIAQKSDPYLSRINW